MSTENGASAIPEEEKSLTLRKPIKLQDREIKTITLREPTAYEIEQVSKRAEKSSQGSNILLISLVSGITEGEIGKMSIRDFNEAMSYVSGFFSNDQKTGS